MRYPEVRQQVVEIARTMAKDGLVRGTAGNVSCRVPSTGAADGLFAVTPSGMDYSIIEPSDIVIIDVNTGLPVESGRKPSVETPLHRLIMAQRPDVGGVVHTHSLYATALACLQAPLPVISTELAALVGGTVPVAPYRRSGSQEFAETAVAALGEHGVAALLQNHGAVAVGRTLKEAYAIAAGLEEAAHLYHLARLLGEPALLPAAECAHMFEFYRTRYGQK